MKGYTTRKNNLPENNELRNTNDSLKDTIIASIFNLMNESKRARLRKFAAYVICLVTFNNNSIQDKI